MKFRYLYIIILIISLLSISNVSALCYNITTTGGTSLLKFNNTTGYCNFTIPSGASTIEYIIVAGGGGGSSSTSGAGGGGGGGILNATSYSILPGSEYNITIGKGGAADVKGQNSSFSNLTINLSANGGGLGGGGNNAGGSGGSGGGGGGNGAAGGANTSGQGWSGGVGVAGSASDGGHYRGGGGGGAGQVGGAAIFYLSTGGAGGTGRNTSITGSLLTLGGGGGGGNDAGTAGAGGLGGGGAGGAHNGVNDTGGGGGGTHAGSSAGIGGTGVVYIKYTDLSAPIPSFTTNISIWDDPLTVQFNDTSSSNILSWSWTFTNLSGNNTAVEFSTSQNPIYTFGVGTWDIRLNVTNASGFLTSQTPYYIYVSPTCKFYSISGDYTIVTFNVTNESFNGTTFCKWIPPANLTSVEYIIVAGGGGGASGGSGNGGGGGGGVLNSTSFSILAGSSYNISIGKGGAVATKGENSTFGNNTYILTTVGGGFGGYGNNAGGSGGSGGGGGGNDASGGANTSGQGWSGGVGVSGSAVDGGHYRGGGGGGAGQVGGAANFYPSTGGAGGTGRNTTITGSLLTLGGGGGGGNDAGTAGAGGLGGGGAGGINNGTNGTGGGGGGAHIASGAGTGGSGIVILKYLAPPTNSPIANATLSNTTGKIPLIVNFTDTSLYATSWNWSFGDGAYSDDRSPTHSYASVGNFTIILNVSNVMGNNNKIFYAESIDAPVSSFTMSNTSGMTPLLVTFTDTSSNVPTSWNWSFGDGNYSILQNPSHTYPNVANYTVILNVSNIAGWSNKTQYVNSTPPPPTTSFTMSPTTGGIPVNVSFTDTSIYTPTSWNWSFGDGTLSTLQNPFHTYNDTGTYTVTLNASNIYGSNTISNNFIATPHVYTSDERITTKVLDTQAFIVGGIYLAVGAVLVTLVAAIFGSKP